MAEFYDSLTDKVQDFIRAQHMFFVASAPLSADGHVNLSPKGLDCFRILSPNRVAYLDMTGSGNETSAHMQENARITLMFCSFEGAPNILRLYGKGWTVLPGSSEWDALSVLFTLPIGVRQIIVADIQQVQTSCGFAVPRYNYVGDRDTLLRYWEHHGADGAQEYQAKNNQCSLDGLPSALGSKQTDPA